MRAWAASRKPEASRPGASARRRTVSERMARAACRLPGAEPARPTTDARTARAPPPQAPASGAKAQSASPAASLDRTSAEPREAQTACWPASSGEPARLHAEEPRASTLEQPEASQKLTARPPRKAQATTRRLVSVSGVSGAPEVAPPERWAHSAWASAHSTMPAAARLAHSPRWALELPTVPTVLRARSPRVHRYPRQ